MARNVAGEKAPYYSLRVQNYVCVVAFSAQDELVLVRQNRPALEHYTLELPSGHVEANETAGTVLRAATDPGGGG